MSQISTILILGAEEQAATSMALAYPERRFVFASDCPIVDGWDLPNVSMLFTSPDRYREISRHRQEVVPLSPRWLPNFGETALSNMLPTVDRWLPGIALALSTRPRGIGRWIVKGDFWHRPDAPIIGTDTELSDVTDPYGCGVIYQEMVPAYGTVMAIGRRTQNGATSMGLVRVLNERFFRVDILQAAQTVEMPGLVQTSLEVLAALAVEGWFTLNWVVTASGPRLSSFRPVPKAIFRCLLQGGVDCLAPPTRNCVANAGSALIAWPSYSQFKWLNRQ
jgi:hypothetical protein